MRSRTIFITVFHSFISKNILNTDVFKILSNNKQIRIVLLVPDIKKDFFTKMYQSESVVVEAVSNEKLIVSSKFRFFSRISHLMVKSNYVTYKRHERLDSNRNLVGYFKFFIDFLLNVFLSKFVFTHTILRNKVTTVSLSEIKKIFDKHQPEMIFSTDAFDESDCLIQIEARRRGVKLVSMVRSWDNCYSKGLLRVIPDKLIVNNHTLKEEAINIHGVPKQSVVVLGSPQYDLFINSERTPRTDFFKSMELDSSKKLILFAPAGKILSKTDGQLIEIFKNAIDRGEFVKPVQFLIRNHPNHPADISATVGRVDMIVEDPGRIFSRNNPKDTELTLSDNEHMADELYYADIIIWVATTLGMDGIVFDKPQIAVDFDGFENNTYFQSVRRYHDEDHMKKMIALGGVRVVNSPEELIKAINDYLGDSTLERDGRAKVRQQQFYKLDGGAGRRIGEFILKEINQ